MSKNNSVSCGGFWTSTTDGQYFDCEYPFADKPCEECVINGGTWNPLTGRRVKKRKSLAKQEEIAIEHTLVM